MDDKQLAKLIRKNVAAAEKAKRPRKSGDPTLLRKETDDADLERDRFFDEMKRREF